MATAELMGAVSLSLLAPLLAAAVAAILLVVLMRLLGHRVRKRRLAGMV
jgi:predicted PurR-regulated permease PerM